VIRNCTRVSRTRVLRTSSALVVGLLVIALMTGVLAAPAEATGGITSELAMDEVFGPGAVCVQESDDASLRSASPGSPTPRLAPRSRRDPDLRFLTWSGLVADPLSEEITFDVRHPDVGLTVRAEAVDGSEAWISVELISPDGQVLSAHDDEFPPVASEIQSGRGTAQMPSTDRPGSKLASGEYRVRVRALPPPWDPDADVSAVVDVVAAFRGEVAVHLQHRLDLNFVYLPESTLSTEIATTNPHFARLLKTIDEALAPAGIRIGEITHTDLDRPEFSVVATWDEAGEMFLTSADFPERRALNVYCLKGFEAPLNPVVGLSGGIPGPPYNGTPDSGIAMRMEPFLRCPTCLEAYGSLFAHEIGHYLGLYHTSEARLEHWDPISDTPECHEDGLNSCPDYDYVMFPVIHSLNRTWSDVQAGVGRTHPLVRTVPVIGPPAHGRREARGDLVLAPNPFRGSVTVAWTGDAAAELTVHDVAGRRVRTMRGASGVTWDGLDDAGVTTPPGVYFVRVRDDAQARVGRVVRLP
jgi:hypothetical protein